MYHHAPLIAAILCSLYLYIQTVSSQGATEQLACYTVAGNPDNTFAVLQKPSVAAGNPVLVPAPDSLCKYGNYNFRANENNCNFTQLYPPNPRCMNRQCLCVRTGDMSGKVMQLYTDWAVQNQNCKENNNTVIFKNSNCTSFPLRRYQNVSVSCDTFAES